MFWMALIMGLPLLGLVLFFVYPWWVALAPYLFLVTASALFDRLMMRAMRLPVRTGREAMIGSTAVVLKWKDDSGQVAHGAEIWEAHGRSGGGFSRGEKVVIESVSELALSVRPAGQELNETASVGGPVDINRKAIEQTRARYSRIAPVYDLLEAPVEHFFWQPFRKRLFTHVRAGEILEIGAGTGKNLPFYPEGAEVTAIDISPAMLERGRRRSVATRVKFQEMDAQALDFSEQSFDIVLATFVFCSVPNPVLGLREARRVCKPTGRLLLLEHVRPAGRFLGRVFDVLNPVMKRLLGPEINRPTVENVQAAGWKIVEVEDLLSDVVKLVVAAP